MKALISTVLFSTGLGLVAHAAGGGKLATIPDFTRGDTIPEKAKKDWNLGPTGARGWMYCDRLVTTDARQIAITTVDKGSPADGVLAVGDVLLGAGGKDFSFDPRTEFGRAVTAAETEKAGGKLVLARWRAGKTEQVVVKLPVMGSFSATAPYDCPKSSRILENGLAALAARAAKPDYPAHLDPIPRSLNALALLAGGDPAHLPLVKREAEWAAEFKADGMQTWHYGYVMLLLAEYVTATGDQSVIPGLRRLALEAARGQSAVGSWGHGFARPDGRLYGYGMMNAPGVPLTIGLVLARDAGVTDPEIGEAIERSARLLRFYAGKGAVPYGDHDPWTETHEDNGKSGMAAVLFNLLGETKTADFFRRMAVASHGSERDCGHTGNYFNILWSMPAIALGGPHATGGWMGEFGGWYHDLARRWDGGFAHLGPPEPDFDSYHGWDATGVYLLAYAQPLRKIALTGRKPGKLSPLEPAEVAGLLADGRGWDNKDRRSAYDRFADAELLSRLGSWSPTVRERAAAALARRKERPMDAIVALLDSANVNARIGACQALEEMGGAAAPAVPQLRQTLQHEDLWLRVKAATALAAIGRPARPALADLLDLIVRGPTPEDPRGMEQRFVASALFNRMLNNPEALKDADMTKLRAAIERGLHNQDGRARSDIGGVYRHLSYEAIEPLLPAVFEAVAKPAPSGEMFADGVRLGGLQVLAAHHIEEGMALAAEYLETQNPWSSENRTPEILKVFQPYGAHARSVIPQLREIAARFDQGEVNFPKQLSKRKAEAVRKAIQEIEAAQERPALRRLK